MRHFDFDTVLGIIIILLCAGVLGLIIAVGVQNEMNEIDSGIIVDKDYTTGYTSYSSDKNGGHAYSTPAKFKFTIEGEKDGETVQYTFEVTEEEYQRYKIGDYYER